MEQNVKCAVAAPDRMSGEDLLSDGFPTNPRALIAVSPLRPQSQQHVAVHNLSEGQGNASEERKGEDFL